MFGSGDFNSIIILVTILIATTVFIFIASPKEKKQIHVIESKDPGMDKSLVELKTITLHHPSVVKKVYITKNKEGGTLHLSDENLTSRNTKEVYKFDQATIGFNTPEAIVHIPATRFALISFTTTQTSDIMIINLDSGGVISKGIGATNAELAWWSITLDKILNESTLQVNLFKTDGSRGQAYVYFENGKVVNGSVVILRGPVANLSQ